jgi:PPOX class probable F420-dependent enzyme
MPTPDEIIPARYRRLLELPLYGHLGTIRPDDTVQVTPMWFEFDGELVRFTHTTYRQKYRNLQHNPSMALSITDPDDPHHYLEVAGRLVDVVPDPEGQFYVRLQNRYGNPSSTPPRDKAERVILAMSLERSTKQ